MLIRNNPWKVLNDLNSILDSGLRTREQDDSNVESSSWIPAVDIKEEVNNFTLSVDIPGVNPKDVEISMENNVLAIKGSREETNNEKKQGYYRVERIKGAFYRRFTLPDTADAEQVTAKSRHGVLEIIIGKKKVSQARKIEIDMNE
jgi:HSP20 family protein